MAERSKGGKPPTSSSAVPEGKKSGSPSGGRPPNGAKKKKAAETPRWMRPGPLPMLPPGAPPEAQAMALLVQWHYSERRRDIARDLFLGMAKQATQLMQPPTPLMPEIATLFQLQQTLPIGLQSFMAEGVDAEVSNEGTLVEYPYEAVTPVLRSSSISFAEAVQIADDPLQWASATPQMEIVRKRSKPLPSNGSLWRWRLTKRTDFGVPLLHGLITEETIDITAEGFTSPDKKSGHRRYAHVLHSSAAESGLVRVTKDTGWIELSGDENGIQLRIQKQASVLRPPDDPYAAILAAGLPAELWLWAMGFIARGGRPQLPPHAQRPLPANLKPNVPPPAGGSYHVAVLGGGPAGLACSWLLSRPTDPTGNAAWSPPANAPNLDVKVTLVEQSCVPGGKAASIRRSDAAEARRVEEHGLHILMGCYANVLELIRWTAPTTNNAVQGNPPAKPWDDALVGFGKTLVPSVDAQGLDDGMWPVEVGPWPTEKSLASLEAWILNDAKLDAWPMLTGFEPERVEMLRNEAARYSPVAREPRPLLRTFAELGKSLLARRSDPTEVPSTTLALNQMAAQWLTVRLMGTELQTASRILSQEDIAPEQQQLEEMAALLRTLSRSALPAGDPAPGVAMLREWVELSTTVTIGLAKRNLFPVWAVDDPKKLLTLDYMSWVRGMQALDTKSLQDWLECHDIEKGFVANSRLLAAITASVFATPATIAAGTFLHGMARLLLTYQGELYRRMKGGTGEAFVAPIFDYLNGLGQPKMDIKLGTSVRSVSMAAKKITGATTCLELQCAGNNIAPQPGIAGGWQRPPIPQTVSNKVKVLAADAYVLAIPPYAGVLPGQPVPPVLPGLPAQLEASLANIGHRATIGVQCWTGKDPRFPGAIISAMPGPLRCAAAMSDLNEGQGFGIPVYACGDVEDDVAQQWDDGTGPLDAWLAAYQPMLQDDAVHKSHASVNRKGSARYTMADVDTQAARLPVYDTGVDNLWIAGDWTRTALSCGSIEAAVTSGLEAARDILEKLGCQVHFEIVGSTTK